jgi:hypothetical protein
MSYTDLECVQDSDVACRGEVESYRSRSGCTVSERCDAHQDAYYERMDALEARLNADYPGYDIPGSAPPAWFDPSYAGESWDGE